MPSVCNAARGFDVDVTIRAELSALYQVWLGRLTLRDAMRDGRVEFDGKPALVRKMPAVLRLSPVAPLVREAFAANSLSEPR